jgi:hypothetical protein
MATKVKLIETGAVTGNRNYGSDERGSTTRVGKINFTRDNI